MVTDYYYYYLFFLKTFLSSSLFLVDSELICVICVMHVTIHQCRLQKFKVQYPR